MILTKDMVIQIIIAHLKDYKKTINIALDNDPDDDDDWLQLNLAKKQAIQSLLYDIEEIEAVDPKVPFYDKSEFEVKR